MTRGNSWVWMMLPCRPSFRILNTTLDFMLLHVLVAHFLKKFLQHINIWIRSVKKTQSEVTQSHSCFIFDLVESKNWRTYHAILRTSWVDAKPSSIFRFSASYVVCEYMDSKLVQCSWDWAATLKTTCWRSPGILSTHNNAKNTQSVLIFFSRPACQTCMKPGRLT